MKEKRYALLTSIVVLLTIGLAASVYLVNLYVEVHNESGQPVESFCAVSDGLNCVTVANSEYSTIAGVPVAV